VTEGEFAVLRRKIKKYLTVCGLLVVVGAIVYIAPMGRSDLQTGTNCGPRAVAALTQEVNVGASDSEVISEQIKTQLRPWDYIPDRISLIGGATLPWGIKHALEEKG
jgi:hypothetical protein